MSESKYILITGANRGLGLGFTKKYLEQNHFVVATQRSIQNVGELVFLQTEFSQHLKIEKLDLENQNDILVLSKRLASKNRKFDLIINNAGVCFDENFGHWQSSTFETSFKVNVIGPALLTQALIPMINEGGKVIQISSGRGSISENQGAHDGLDAYGISKTALNMLTKRLASKAECQNITIASIDPGWIQTDMGGTEAPLTIQEAVDNLVRTIEQLTLKDSGKFLNTKGQSIDW